MSDNNHLPIQPITQYIEHLQDLGRLPSTISTCTSHLKLYRKYLHDTCLDWTDVDFQKLNGFGLWLHQPVTASISVQSQERIRSRRTINMILSTVYHFYAFHYLLELGYSENLRSHPDGQHGSFQHHVMKVMKSRLQLLKLKETSPAIETFNQEQVNQLISACDTLRDKFLIRLFYETGMWARQALELYREDVRSEENQINLVCRTDNVNRAGARLRKPNTIHVTPSLIELYLQYLETEYPKDLTSDYIFVSLKGRGIGRALTYSAVNQLFQCLSRKTGILASARKFRYTHAYDLFCQGCPVELIGKRLGIMSGQVINKFFLWN